MDSHNSRAQIDELFKKHHETSPAIVMWFILLSAGLYIINWIYLRNKEIEEIDESAPEPRRGAVVLILLPFGWYLIMYVIKSLSGEISLLLGIMEIVVWGLIIFLIYNYLWDFCYSFATLTKTGVFLWFGLFLCGGVGIISTFFEFYYLTPLIFFTVIAIPAMQAELGTIAKNKFSKRKSSILSMH